MITDRASKTNKPPAINRAISCFVIKLTVPNNPPSANEPVSPMKIFAGGALYHKNPKHAPTVAPKTMQTSEIFLIEFNINYTFKQFSLSLVRIKLNVSKLSSTQTNFIKSLF